MKGGARVRLKGWQQAAVAVGSAVGALLNPRRADLIAALGETTGKPAFERVLQKMKMSQEGRVSFLLFTKWQFILQSVSIRLIDNTLYHRINVRKGVLCSQVSFI